MRFDHQLLPPLCISSTTTPEGRYYKLDDGSLLPSVTTVLSRMMDKTALEEWKKRVGEEEAEKVKNRAAWRGTIIHEAAEKFLRNETGYTAHLTSIQRHFFQDLEHILARNVTTVLGIELPLYSKALFTAGRTDLIAEWDRVPSIIDFKTSKRLKTDKDILPYFLQSTVYAYMASRIYGIKIPQIVIVMLVDHDNPIIFKKNVIEYIDEAINIFQLHRETYCLNKG